MQLRTFFTRLDSFHQNSLSNFEKRELYGRVFGVGDDTDPSCVTSRTNSTHRPARMDNLSCHVGLRPPRRRLRRDPPKAALRCYTQATLVAFLSWLHLGVWNDLDACYSNLVCVFVHWMGRCCFFHIQHVRVSDSRAQQRIFSSNSSPRTIQIGYICVRVFEKKKDYSSDGQPSWKTKLWKWLHGTFMFYSFVMLLGAGISFPFRSVSGKVRNFESVDTDVLQG